MRELIIAGAQKRVAPTTRQLLYVDRVNLVMSVWVEGTGPSAETSIQQWARWVARLGRCLRKYNLADRGPAFQSDADEVFYGGAAGGGKSFLLLGLALSAHHDSIIFRREYLQLRELIQQSRRLLAGRGGRFNANENVWRLPGGRSLEFGAVQHEWDVERFQGRHYQPPAPCQQLGFEGALTTAGGPRPE